MLTLLAGALPSAAPTSSRFRWPAASLATLWVKWASFLRLVYWVCFRPPERMCRSTSHLISHRTLCSQQSPCESLLGLFAKVRIWRQWTVPVWSWEYSRTSLKLVDTKTLLLLWPNYVGSGRPLLKLCARLRGGGWLRQPIQLWRRQTQTIWWQGKTRELVLSIPCTFGLKMQTTYKKPMHLLSCLIWGMPTCL